MDEIKAFATKWMNKSKITPIYYSEITKIGKKKRRFSILIMSETEIFIISKTGFFNKIKVSHIFQLIDLKGVNVSPKGEATIAFNGKTFSFTCSNIKEVLNKIICQAKMLLTKHEFELIPLPAIIKDLCKSTPVSFLFRMQIKLNQLKPPVSLSFLPNIQSEMLYENKTLKLNIFPIRNDIYPILFDSLCLNSGFTELCISQIVGIDIFKVLADSFNFSSKIENIVIKQSINDSFVNFINAYSNAKKAKLSSLSFIKANITEKEVKSLKSVLAKDKLISLTFKETITHNLLMDLLSAPTISNLMYLALKSIKLELNSIAIYMTNLHTLSLVNCDLSISDFLSLLCELNYDKLRLLNLSKNRSGSKIEKFPSKLEQIVVNNVEWEEDSFISFMNLCSLSTIPMKLSIANAKIQNNGIDEAINLISSFSKCSFSALVWDGNPLSTHLVIYLKKSKYLSYLSLVDCSGKQIISDICLFLDKNSLIEVFRFQSPKSSNIGDITPICDMFPSCSNLTELNLSNLKISNAEIKYLSGKLILCQSLKAISLNGTSATSITPFVELAQLLISSERRVRLSWPFSDIARLRKNGVLNDTLEAELLLLLQQLSFGTFSTNTFLKPNRVHCDNMKLEFPKYLSHKDLSRIDENRYDTCLKITNKSFARDGIQLPEVNKKFKNLDSSGNTIPKSLSSNDNVISSTSGRSQSPMNNTQNQNSEFKSIVEKLQNSPHMNNNDKINNGHESTANDLNSRHNINVVVNNSERKSANQGTPVEVKLDWEFPLKDIEIDTDTAKFDDLETHYTLRALVANMKL